MDEKERIIRALLGTLVSVDDVLSQLNYTAEQVGEMIHPIVAAACLAMDIPITSSQLMRLKEEAFMFIGGVMKDDLE